MSKIEDFLNALLNDELANVEAKTRVEKYLKACCEKCGCEGLPEPKTRIDALLYELAEKMKGGGGGILPPEYQQVTHIRSTGSQYIALDNLTDSGWAIECVAAVYSSDEKRIFGVTGIENKTRIVAGINPDGFYFGIGSKNNDISASNINRVSTFLVDVPNNKCTINGTEYSGGSTGFYGGYTCYVFAAHDSNAVPQNIITGDIFLFKIYQNGITICNLIPCYRKSDNVVGMYDVVARKFYTNAGTGVFLKGADV